MTEQTQDELIVQALRHLNEVGKILYLLQLSSAESALTDEPEEDAYACHYLTLGEIVAYLKSAIAGHLSPLDRKKEERQ